MGNQIISARGPKVRVIASPSTWMEGEALRQLDEASRLEGMVSVVGMPDLHPGKGSPVGAAFLSEGFIHPLLVGSDIGCGMRLVATDLPVKKARPDKLATLMEGLDLPWDGDTAAWLAGRGVDPGPHDAGLGSPGFGNHFIEVILPRDVADPFAFSAMGLSRDRAALIVHSGSRGLGEAILREHAAMHGGNPLVAGSAKAEDYVGRHGHAVRWASANRELCALRACEAIGADGSTMLDICHNSVTAATVGGCSCWLHRKGAAPSDMGPVIIPGSRGDPSYLVRPVSGRADALTSLAHGAGRKIPRQEARGKLSGFMRKEDLRRNPYGGTVVCGDDRLAWEEAPACYKDIHSVVGDLVAAGLAEVVATFVPLVTFKTSAGTALAARSSRREWQDERRSARSAKEGRAAR